MSWIKRLDEFIDRQNIKSSELCKIVNGIEQQILDAENVIRELVGYDSLDHLDRGSDKKEIAKNYWEKYGK
jgi:hypothetical protein